jgi:2-polyprenyl-6-methoxyphenol hydroxylase-like FAD-dependent oxidoreductase
MARVVVVGAGPIGLFTAMAMARRGHDVCCVDRDPGAATAGEWNRLGVMQFHLPHFFRPTVRNELVKHLPDVFEAMTAAGAIPLRMDGMPEEMTNLACRRSVFEHTFRKCAEAEPNLTFHIGHAERVAVGPDGRTTGVVVDARLVEADIVIGAAGRTSHFGQELRAEAIGGPCGFAYAARMYRAKDGVEPCLSPVPLAALADGYLSIVFPQDDRTLCALIVRPADDKALVNLRHEEAHRAAMAAIPNLAAWTDPDRFEPIAPVLAGAGLNNTYSLQGVEPGVAPALGLYFVGDAVCTTNPAAGRGITLGLRQANKLLEILDDPSLDHADASASLEAWCDAEIEPWFQDHVYWDKTLLRRFAGDDIDLDAKIPSDVVCEAAMDRLPHLMPLAGVYMGMLALPSVLDGAQDETRELLRTGWRPAYAPGPTRDELVEAMSVYAA